MIDEKVARLRAHGNNINRYRRLLTTNLSELERQFVERRLNEEEAAMESLTARRSSDRAGKQVCFCGQSHSEGAWQGRSPDFAGTRR
jgi:hypothetical protein